MRTAIILGILLFMSFYGYIGYTLHNTEPQPEIGTALICTNTPEGIDCNEH